jgi:hypothetical protein
MTDSDAERLRHTIRSQHGQLKKQGQEIVRLRRQRDGALRAIQSMERINGRLAKDLIDAWEFIWQVAGGALVGAGARHRARNHLLSGRSTEADRAIRKVVG